jgi:hypothetical protein
MNIENILGAMPSVFWSAVAGFFVLVTGVALLVSRLSSASARKQLADWARQSGFAIVSAVEKHGRCGPFTWAAGGRGAKVFQIVVRDAAGSTRSGWARMMIEPEIIWDAKTPS